MTRTVPEPNAELLSAEDVQQDVASLTDALERRRAERHAYEVLARREVREILNKLITSGACTNEEEAIERALRTLLTAVTR
jgi:hypothetical protein